jgi:hypothetical protein
MVSWGFWRCVVWPSPLFGISVAFKDNLTWESIATAKPRFMILMSYLANKRSRLRVYRILQGSW